MIDVAALNVIRRYPLRDQLSIREIARLTGPARNTVKKSVRSDHTELQYAKRASLSRRAPYAEKPTQLLEPEVTRSRKWWRTLRQIRTDVSEEPAPSSRLYGCAYLAILMMSARRLCVCMTRCIYHAHTAIYAPRSTSSATSSGAWDSGPIAR